MKKQKRKKVLTISCTALALVSVFGGLASLSACGGNARSSNTQTTAAETREVTDDLGRTVTIPLKVTRVVSLAPNLTENIFAVGAGERLVGVTTFCNYPEQARAIAKIGDTMTPNMESIIALKPDIVFVSTASQIETFMKTLDANGIAVYVTNPNDLNGVMNNLRQLGDLFGTQATADKLVADLQKRIKEISTKAFGPLVWDNVEGHQPMPVFVQISREPLFTIGKQSFLTSSLGIADARSVTADVPSAYPKLSKETALALDPHAIILSDSEDNREPNEAFRSSPAVKKGRVYKVNADLLSRPGPRLVDALEQIAKSLHPENFK